MLKEIKYLIFIIIIGLFIFFTGRYYFSDDHKKNSYRSYKDNNEKKPTYIKNQTFSNPLKHIYYNLYLKENLND